MYLVSDLEATTKEPTNAWLLGFAPLKEKYDKKDFHIQTNIKDYFKELVNYLYENFDGEKEQIVFFIILNMTALFY